MSLGRSHFWEVARVKTGRTTHGGLDAFPRLSRHPYHRQSVGELYITEDWESEYVFQECSEFSPAVPQLEVVDAH